MKLLRQFWPAPVVAGALMWAAFPPLDLGFLMIAGWTLLLVSMRLRRGERAGMQVFVASLVCFIPGLSWLEPLVWVLWFVVALWCAGWQGIWGRFAGRLLRREGGPPAAWVVVLPALFLATDMLRTVVLTGFPWMLPGYSAWKNPVLIGSADLIGVHGATLAILALAAGAAECIARILEKEPRPARALIPAAALWAVLAAWAFGKPAPAESPGPTLLLLQPNIPQVLKEEGKPGNTAEEFSALSWKAHEDLAAKGLDEAKASGRKIDVVVWAETMSPTFALRPLVNGHPLVKPVRGQNGRREDSNADTRRITAIARGAHTLAGMPTYQLIGGDAVPLQFNTEVLLDPDGRILGFQDKQHLTPGGEYIPLRWLIPFREDFELWLKESVGFLPDLRPGEQGYVLPFPGGARAGVMICYESVYPEVPREMVRSGATMLLNCSNYGWFAHTAEMDQALAICAWRAAELRRPLVLSSNNGMCALLGPDGRVRGPMTATDVPAHLIVQVPQCESRSPFLLVGEWAAAAIGAAGAISCVFLSRRKNPALVSAAP